MPPKKTSEKRKKLLLWGTLVRVGLGLAVLPFAPFLYKEHFLILVLLRPTKEILLAGGFFLKRGDVGLIELFLAGLPLMLLAVWKFFFLGRAFSTEIRSGKVPLLGKRVLPPDKIKEAQKVLRKKGPRLVFLARLAVLLSSATVAAAAGSSNMDKKGFLIADGLGALASFAIFVGLGFALGNAYEEAGPWVTAGGVVVLLGMGAAFGRYINRV
ncbi:MAG TPA: VTT domain-containing protein [Actinomycetota bacterium]|nr:VTT domain-containing protein [Actinomycetota bacterium]